jgi:hypothetical protein
VARVLGKGEEAGERKKRVDGSERIELRFSAKDNRKLYLS